MQSKGVQPMCKALCHSGFHKKTHNCTVRPLTPLTVVGYTAIIKQNLNCIKVHNEVLYMTVTAVHPNEMVTRLLKVSSVANWPVHAKQNAPLIQMPLTMKQSCSFLVKLFIEMCKPVVVCTELN